MTSPNALTPTDASTADTQALSRPCPVPSSHFSSFHCAFAFDATVIPGVLYRRFILNISKRSSTSPKATPEVSNSESAHFWLDEGDCLLQVRMSLESLSEVLNVCSDGGTKRG